MIVGRLIMTITNWVLSISLISKTGCILLVLGGLLTLFGFFWLRKSLITFEGGRDNENGSNNEEDDSNGDEGNPLEGSFYFQKYYLSTIRLIIFIGILILIAGLALIVLDALIELPLNFN